MIEGNLRNEIETARKKILEFGIDPRMLCVGGNTAKQT
jgi:hypothetical protein